MDSKNQLYYGDNYDVLKRYIKDESVDLIYLDPPFNSRQDYNVLFAEKDGSQSSSQIEAFKDTWEWNIDAQRSLEYVIERGGRVAEAMIAFKTLLGNTDMMAYLAMMAPRMVELRRVLKETGSIYLHCDSTASHFLRLLMDAVFQPDHFRTEIIWKRTASHGNVSTSYGDITDTILYYRRGEKPVWNQVYVPYSAAYAERYFRHIDENGRRYASENCRNPGMRPNLSYVYKNFKPHRNGWAFSKEKMEEYDRAGRLIFPKTLKGRIRLKRYLDDQPGEKVQNLWVDIPPIHSKAAERLGYPTQKPEALLERILRASSNEGDLVLDPFCGCGTTVQVAQRLNRRWIGIDITHLAIGLIKKRLVDGFPNLDPPIQSTYEVIGEPTDLAGAARLAADEKYQFQYWALDRAGAATATSERKKGADRGIDGRLRFHDDESGSTKQIVFSVKSGAVGVDQVRDLRGVIERDKAEIGVFITLQPPTKPMMKEAADAGFYRSSDGSSYPRLQVLTVQQLLDGKQPEYPLHRRDATFKRAPRSRPDAATNYPLPLSATVLPDGND